MNIDMIIADGIEKAKIASDDYLELNGDKHECGAVYVEIAEYEGKKLNGRMSIYKELKKHKMVDSLNRKLSIWNIVNHRNLSACEVGVEVFINHLRSYGFTCYSRTYLL